jgi:hypothetical protein
MQFSEAVQNPSETLPGDAISYALVMPATMEQSTKTPNVTVNSALI